MPTMWQNNEPLHGSGREYLILSAAPPLLDVATLHRNRPPNGRSLDAQVLFEYGQMNEPGSPKAGNRNQNSGQRSTAGCAPLFWTITGKSTTWPTVPVVPPQKPLPSGEALDKEGRFVPEPSGPTPSPALSPTASAIQAIAATARKPRLPTRRRTEPPEAPTSVGNS
jgi:hypothetical protein